MNRTLTFLIATTSLFAATGCTGLSLGENNAGGSVWLEGGAIAVDHQSETAFVMSTRNEILGSSSQQNQIITHKTLFAVGADEGEVSEVASLDGRNDTRILFPDSGVLVMSEEAQQDRLQLLDRDSFEPLATAQLDVRYHGTRMSPSRQWIGVADNTNSSFPIHIIDGQTLDQHVVPHGGDWLEATWLNNSDELVAIVFYDNAPDEPYARILSWEMSKVLDANFEADESGYWPNPNIDVTVPGVKGDLAFSFTWIGVSPDDSTLAFPVQLVKTDEATHALLVMDRETQSVTALNHAKGPVGFTPDSKTIVSYADTTARDNAQDLWLINAETLDVDEQPVPIDGGISYFVSHEGNFVVVASSTGGQNLVLYDIDQEQQTKMDGAGVDLLEFVSRTGHGEMWLADNSNLHRLSFNDGTFETVPTSFRPQHINIQPQRDRLVLDDSSSAKLFFFNPDTLSVEMSAELPE